MNKKELVFLGEEVSGGGFLLKVYSGETIELNKIGVEIWNAERWEKELAAISEYEKLRAEAEINSSIERRSMI